MHCLGLKNGAFTFCPLVGRLLDECSEFLFAIYPDLQMDGQDSAEVCFGMSMLLIVHSGRALPGDQYTLIIRDHTENVSSDLNFMAHYIRPS